MNVTEMVRRVSTEAEVDEDAARAVLDATLRTLAERINGDEARHLAAQLPPEVGAVLVETAETSPEGTPFDADDFEQRVIDRTGEGAAESERSVKAVFDALRGAVEPGEWSDVMSQLPSDMDRFVRGDRPSDHNG